ILRFQSIPALFHEAGSATPQRQEHHSAYPREERLNEALFQAGILLLVAAHRAARVGPSIRPRASRYEGRQDRNRPGLLLDQPEGLRACASARRKCGAYGGGRHRPVPGRSQARGAARSRARLPGALPTAGVAQLHRHRIAQRIRRTAVRQRLGGNKTSGAGGVRQEVGFRRPTPPGERVTVADAYLFTVLTWSKGRGIELERWPALKRYFDRILARPAVRAAMQAEGVL